MAMRLRTVYHCGVCRSHDSEIIYEQIGFKLQLNSFHPREKGERRMVSSNQSEVVVGGTFDCGFSHSLAHVNMKICDTHNIYSKTNSS